MSRIKRIMLAVQAWPRCRVGKLYEGIIRSVHVDRRSRSLHVTIENLDSIQSGRIHEVIFTTGLFPGNKTARFFTAAGQDTNTVGKQICLDDIVGVVVGMRFGTADGSDKEIEFERIESPQAINADVSVKESRDEAPASGR